MAATKNLTSDPLGVTISHRELSHFSRNDMVSVTPNIDRVARRGFCSPTFTRTEFARWTLRVQHSDRAVFRTGLEGGITGS